MKNKNWINPFRIATTFIVFALSSTTNATVLYDESVSGDSYGGQLFTLSNGTNTFVGSQTWNDPVDGFRFIVAPGTQATISMNYTYINTNVGDQSDMEWALIKLPDSYGACAADPNFPYQCVGAPPGSTVLAYLSAKNDPNFSSLPLPQLSPAIILSSGTYSFGDNFRFIGRGTSAENILVYTIDVEQVAVPLPSAALPFSSVLLGVMGFRRLRA